MKERNLQNIIDTLLTQEDRLTYIKKYLCVSGMTARV